MKALFEDYRLWWESVVGEVKWRRLCPVNRGSVESGLVDRDGL